MNAVNLLPAKHRPRTPTGGQQGSSYAVIGVLGVALVMALVFAVTVNSINTKKAAVAKTKAETAQAQKRAESLAAYGNFIQVKEQRVSSVKQLATGRIDWERLTLGLAHVLPPKVWLKSVNASSTGNPSGDGASAGAGAADAGGAKPTMVMTGCAPSQSEVAVTLVRLRHLPNVEDVTLSTILKPEAPAGPAGPQGAPAPAAPAAPGQGGQDCGTVSSKAAYKFEATVIFKPQAGSTPPAGEKKVPAALGGGA